MTTDDKLVTLSCKVTTITWSRGTQLPKFVQDFRPWITLNAHMINWVWIWQNSSWDFSMGYTRFHLVAGPSPDPLVKIGLCGPEYNGPPEHYLGGPILLWHHNAEIVPGCHCYTCKKLSKLFTWSCSSVGLRIILSLSQVRNSSHVCMNGSNTWQIVSCMTL